MADILRPDERFGLALRALYRSRGYLPYRMSKFEPYDLYAKNKSFLVSEHILTFTDTDGRLMALKPDVTLSIVKNAPDAPGTLQKVYYHESVYRTSSAAMGYREIPQAGLECIGTLDLASVAEVVSLAAESMALLGDNWLLDLGHMGLVSGLLEGLPGGRLRGELLAQLDRKNVPAIRELCAQAGAAHDLSEKLCFLAGLYGPPEEVLPRLADLGGGAEAALEELRSLCGLLAEQALAENLRLDFSIANGMGYYNGIVFRGYLPGLASGVLAGGRYDNLLRKMGRQGGAVGFAVYLDQLERLEETESGYDGDVLLLYRPEDDPAAVAAKARALGRDGRVVRTDRREPPGLRFRETVRFEEGGQA